MLKYTDTSTYTVFVQIFMDLAVCTDGASGADSMLFECCNCLTDLHISIQKGQNDHNHPISISAEYEHELISHKCSAHLFTVFSVRT